MSLIRKLNRFELDFFGSYQNILAVRLTDKKHTPLAVKQAYERICGLWLDVKNGYFVPKEKTQLRSIPSDVHTLEEASIWIKTLPFDNLVDIATKDDMLVMSFNHSVSDGGILVKLVETLGEDVPGFGNLNVIQATDLFRDEIKKIKEGPVDPFSDFYVYAPTKEREPGEA